MSITQEINRTARHQRLGMPSVKVVTVSSFSDQETLRRKVEGVKRTVERRTATDPAPVLNIVGFKTAKELIERGSAVAHSMQDPVFTARWTAYTKELGWDISKRKAAEFLKKYPMYRLQ